MDGSSSRRRRRNEGGAAAVEFAMILPLLCFLLFAIISYGYMLSFRQALSQAAAEGARAAAAAPPSLPDIPPTAGDDSRRSRAIDAVNQGLGSYGVTCVAAGSGTPVLMHGSEQAGTCAISAPQPCAGSSSSATCVKVTVAYTYEDDSLLPTFPGLGVLLPEQMSYTTEAEVS